MTETWHRGDWMQTHSGRKFYPTDPRPEDVDIEDIAHALGMLCRYAGHVDRFYSVAEHSVLVSYAVPEEYAFEALLHDATEAYVVDVPRPLKSSLPEYRRIENRVAVAIAFRFGPRSGLLVIDGQTGENEMLQSPRVKEADSRILLDERAALMSNTRHPWGVDDLEPLGVTVEGWTPEVARARFLGRFVELGGEA